MSNFFTSSTGLRLGQRIGRDHICIGGNGLAHRHGVELRQLLCITYNQLSKPRQVSCTFAGTARTPVFESSLCGVDGEIDIFLQRLVNLTDLFTIRWVRYRKTTPRLSGYKL